MVITRRWKRGVKMDLDDFHVIRVIIGEFADQHLVEQYAQGIDIGRGSNDTSCLLRSHVVWGSRYLIQGNRFSYLFCLRLLGVAYQPKISQVDIRCPTATAI